MVIFSIKRAQVFSSLFFFVFFARVNMLFSKAYSKRESIPQMAIPKNMGMEADSTAPITKTDKINRAKVAAVFSMAIAAGHVRTPVIAQMNEIRLSPN